MPLAAEDRFEVAARRQPFHQDGRTLAVDNAAKLSLANCTRAGLAGWSLFVPAGHQGLHVPALSFMNRYHGVVSPDRTPLYGSPIPTHARSISAGVAVTPREDEEFGIRDPGS